MGRKDFLKHNDSFSCLHCSEKNSPAAKSERNHCRACLYSLHVDEKTPGDRKSRCLALMEPVSLDYRGNKGFMILHRCIKCRKEMWNKASGDDRVENIQLINSKHQIPNKFQ